jgi:hypothetical protein
MSYKSDQNEIVMVKAENSLTISMSLDDSGDEPMPKPKKEKEGGGQK